MEMNWSTFVLEILNFLVLVWILKHFLYKPVLDVIARRRAGIEKIQANAEALHTDAAGLKEQYEGRLADWEQERQQLREALARELDAERTRQTAELQAALEQESQKAQVAEARRQADARRNIEETALVQGARFATRLLEQACGPDTEARLVELVTTGLTRLPAEHITALRNSYGEIPESAVVVSAFTLADEQRQRLEQALAAVTTPDLPVRFEENGELLAGVRITIGAWVLGANLQDELQGFMQLAHDE